MPYVAAIGHRIQLSYILDKFSFEDLDEAETTLEEAGITLFPNDSDEVFVVITNKHKIIEGDKYVDLNFVLTEEEHKTLETYTGHSDKRVKLFWIDMAEEETIVDPTVMIEAMFNKMKVDGDADDSTIIKTLKSVGVTEDGEYDPNIFNKTYTQDSTGITEDGHLDPSVLLQ